MTAQLNNQILMKGRPKPYIYKNDIRKFLMCGVEDASRIFDEVKQYELDNRAYEMFENRVPQDLFHEWRCKKANRRKHD